MQAIWLGVSEKDDGQMSNIVVGFRQHFYSICFQGYAFGVFSGIGCLPRQRRYQPDLADPGTSGQGLPVQGYRGMTFPDDQELKKYSGNHYLHQMG